MNVRRYLAVHLPAFRLERCGYGADDVVALIAEERGATRLVATTPGARRAGLRRGVTATEARALVPEVELIPHDPVDELADRADLVRAFEALSDRVAFPWDDSLLLEITHVCHGDEHGLVRRALGLADDLGHAARAAVADDPLAARAIAEWHAPDGGSVVVAAGDGARALAPLPIAALALDPELSAALQAIGVDTIGRFAALDPAAVSGRYGKVAARTHRVARGGTARGVVVERPVDPGRPSAWVAMAGATTRQEIGFVLPGLLADVADRLAALDQAAVRLRVVLRLEGGAGGARSTAVVVRVGRPTRAVKTLERLVQARLDRLEIEAPIDELGIEVVESAIDVGWQPGLTDRTEDREPLPDLLARLSDQLGDDALFTPIRADAWRPETSWAPARFPRPELAAVRPSDRADRADPVAIQEERERGLPLPRPSLLLPTAERIELVVRGAGPTEQPVRARLDHAWHPVDQVSGPERLCGEWWLSAPLDRTYWAIQVQARGLWVYRDHAGWWLHGYFD